MEQVFYFFKKKKKKTKSTIANHCKNQAATEEGDAVELVNLQDHCVLEDRFKLNWRK